jgi:hypothetical protein
VDENVAEDEQRLTIAHETAHLLLHYICPRMGAIRAFGLPILAVLDRTRPATMGERLSSVLRNVPIEPFRHAMDRHRHHNAVNSLEGDADDLAVELLAPYQEVRAMGRVEPGTLREQFGLPATVAARLASLAVPSSTTQGVMGLFAKK